MQIISKQVSNRKLKCLCLDSEMFKYLRTLLI